jgi:hypothetical protein
MRAYKRVSLPAVFGRPSGAPHHNCFYNRATLTDSRVFRVAPICSNCGATDFVWANDLKTGTLGGGGLSLRSRGELALGTRICRACGHADLFLKDPAILRMPHTWRPGEFVPITPAPTPPATHHPSGPAHSPSTSTPSTSTHAGVPPATPTPPPPPSHAPAPTEPSTPPPPPELPATTGPMENRDADTPPPADAPSAPSSSGEESGAPAATPKRSSRRRAKSKSDSPSAES